MKGPAAVVGRYAGPFLILTISGSVGFVGMAAASTPTDSSPSRVQAPRL
ncbi:hypothetical protein ACGFYV_09695 [Streptomyces sp. NPDC048297]